MSQLDAIVVPVCYTIRAAITRWEAVTRATRLSPIGFIVLTL